ncbi:chloride channel protein [Streptococcus equinus]|uniref:chloride channel protein n=1 Tax=Streptococcus equinus TaxID=1335 RepID=UPI00088E197A|nr:chloride channel protein [Streptococcus equinus]SDI37394.1 H+/Cl-antiporter ClcA [Streptococcus equinus]SEP57790.1 H+/Cl-antiporter ClcA [Streptococcus equinus]
MIKKLKDNQDYSLNLLGKLVGLSILIGILIGCVDAIFGRVLLALSDFRVTNFNYLIPFLGLVGLLIVYLYQKADSRAAKGMGLMFAVGRGEEDEIPLILLPLVTVSTWATHLFGGSAGREGVAVQLGATISHAFSRFISFENSSRLFLVIGMAAGFAGLFQTPLAAVFFGLEILVLGKLQLVALLPMTVASFVASTTSHFLGLEKFSHFVDVSLNLDIFLFFKLALVGIIFGLVGNAFAVFLAFSKEKAKEVFANPYYRILFGGIFLSLLFLMFFNGRYSGLGTNLITASFSGGDIHIYDWLLKLIFTAATLAIGFQGGEVTPLFAIGASLGVVLAKIFGLPVEFVAAAGYISVFGSATNTLLAPIFIGGEVFGFANLPYFTLVMIFAYSLNRRNSIYTGQEVLSF